MGMIIFIVIFCIIIYLIFKFARDYMLLIGVVVLVIGIILIVIGYKSEGKTPEGKSDGKGSDMKKKGIACSIAGGIMIVFGVYIKWFMPGA